jgi:acetoin utilization protein AcuB
MKDLLRSIQLRDVMNSPVITVHERDDFHVVQDKFATYDIRHLPVIDDFGKVAGMISQRHLYKIHSPRHLENGEWYYDKDMLDSFILKNVMVKDLYLLKPENTLEEAIEYMINFKIGCIPIVDEENRPVGIVTRDTILGFFLKYEEDGIKERTSYENLKKKR